MRQKVIVLGSNYMTRLSLIRSICEVLDFEVTVVDMVHSIPKKRRMMPADYRSKYVKRHLWGLKFQEEALCDLLLKECAVEGTKPFLLSVDDDSACLIDKNYDRLKKHFVCANIHDKQGEIANLMNKQWQKELAKSFGFNVAKSWVIEYHDGKYVVPHGITYPCFVKGLMSYHTMKAQQGRYNSRKELEAALEQISPTFVFPMIAEEFLEIEQDLGVIGVCNGRKCVVPGVVELLDGGHGSHHGVSAFGRVRKEREGEDIIKKVSFFVESIGLCGLFNIDLVVSKGKLYFVELNLRYAAYGYAVARAGVNLPVLYIKDVHGEPLEKTCCNQLTDSYYINERVALDDVIRGYRTLNDFRKMKKQADFGLMENEKDRKPYTMMKWQAVELYIKQRIWWLLKGK